MARPTAPRPIAVASANPSTNADLSRLSTRDRLLTTSDLQGLNAQDLSLLRNEIYARHGRRFADRSLQRYFESQAWYQPRYAPGEFPISVLSQTELRNAILIREYQRSQGLL